MGELLNTSHDTISLWENGASKPDADMIIKLCVIFDISADELLEIETDIQRKEIKINNSF